jgi:hypothetical protein
MSVSRKATPGGWRDTSLEGRDGRDQPCISHFAHQGLAAEVRIAAAKLDLLELAGAGRPARVQADTCGWKSSRKKQGSIY